MLKAAFLLCLPMTLVITGVPAFAQVHVVIDGQPQDVPDGIIRTISYGRDRRQIIQDEPFVGKAVPGAAVVTTTETTDEDEHGNILDTTVVTRIEPFVAIAYMPPAQQAVYYPAPQAQAAPPFSRPHLDVDPDALAVEHGPSDLQPIRVRRDPVSGHFIATIRINGIKVRAIVDTGAQGTILAPQDAHATGADRDITRSEVMAGIGGYTMLDVTRVRSMEVAGQQLGGFTAAIGQQGLPYTLLGQTEIGRLGRIVIEDGVMTIIPRAMQVAAR